MMPNTPHSFRVGDHVEVRLRIEFLTEPVVDECPKCGHQSRVTATAILMCGDSIASGPNEYQRCVEGCDDELITAEGVTP